MERTIFRKLRTPAMLFGVVAGSAALATAGVGKAKEKYCRPVMPETVVNLVSDGLPVANASLLVTYAEDATRELGVSGFPKDRRYNSCQSSGTNCVAMRGRTEFRFNNTRHQGIQIRGMGATGVEGRNNPGNPIIGNVYWEGDSYPARVTIDCDLADLDPETACTLAGTQPFSEIGDLQSVNSRHDQCRPNSFSTSSMLSFTHVGRP